MLQARFDPISNQETWKQTIEVLDDDTGEPVDLSAATITVTIENLCGDQLLQATIANGRISVSNPGYFTFVFYPADLSVLANPSTDDEYFDYGVTTGIGIGGYWGNSKASEFRIGCLITIGGIVTQLFVGTLPVVRGL